MGIFMNSENNEKIDMYEDDEKEIPFGGTEKDVWIDFKCKKCGYEEQVPEFLAFECYIEEEFDEESGSPITLCPKCDSDMIIKKG